MSTIAERVAAGAAFLDEHDLDWWRADVERAINVDRLNLRRGDMCVLGQRCPVPAEPHRAEYVVYGLQLSGLDDPDALWEWGVPLGITAPLEYGGDRMDDAHDELAAEWKRVITGRRSAS